MRLGPALAVSVAGHTVAVTLALVNWPIPEPDVGPQLVVTELVFTDSVSTGPPSLAPIPSAATGDATLPRPEPPAPTTNPEDPLPAESAIIEPEQPTTAPEQIAPDEARDVPPVAVAVIEPEPTDPAPEETAPAATPDAVPPPVRIAAIEPEQPAPVPEEIAPAATPEDVPPPAYAIEPEAPVVPEPREPPAPELSLEPQAPPALVAVQPPLPTEEPAPPLQQWARALPQTKPAVPDPPAIPRQEPPPAAEAPVETETARRAPPEPPPVAPATNGDPVQDSSETQTADRGPAGQATPGIVPKDAAPAAGNAPPRYPRAARRRGLEGRVVVEATIDPAGRVVAANVQESSGYGLLDRAALDAIKRWRFEPAERDGRPVEATVAVPVVFTLQVERETVRD